MDWIHVAQGRDQRWAISWLVEGVQFLMKVTHVWNIPLTSQKSLSWSSKGKNKNEYISQIGQNKVKKRGKYYE